MLSISELNKLYIENENAIRVSGILEKYSQEKPNFASVIFKSKSETTRLKYKPFFDLCGKDEKRFTHLINNYLENTGAIKRELGTHFHMMMEMSLNGTPLGYDSFNMPFVKICSNITNELKSKFSVFFTEVKMYSQKRNYKGTCDFLGKNRKTETWMIVDYKVLKKLDETTEYNGNGKKKYMKGIFSEVEDCNFHKYSLQQTFYKLALIEHGYNVTDCFLYVIEDGVTKIKKCVDYSNLVNNLGRFD